MSISSIKKEGGFTLLEILIVLIILGVIAGIAIPAFTNQVERGRAQEAFENLRKIRESATRFHARTGSYMGATLRADCAFTQATLDFSPQCGPGGAVIPAANLWFTYTYAPTGANAYTVNARRTAANAGNCANQDITINQDGTTTVIGSCYV